MFKQINERIEKLAKLTKEIIPKNPDNSAKRIDLNITNKTSKIQASAENNQNKKNIAARAGQDSKRVGVGKISVLGKVFSPIVRAVFEKSPKRLFLRKKKTKKKSPIVLSKFFFES